MASTASTLPGPGSADPLIGEAPLLEFALVSGFAVQSHVVRHVRELIGVSPAIFQSLQQL